MKRRQWIRGGIILGVVAALVIGFLVNLQLEPSDYRDSLAETVNRAQTLLDDVTIGNEAGQYAKQKVLQFEQMVEQARDDAENEQLEQEQLKRSYQAFDAELASFRNASNREVLEREQVQTLVDDGDSLERSVPLDEDTQLTWIISGETLTEAATINLEAGLASAYEGEIETLLASVSYRTVTLYHEGDLSGRVEVSLPYESESSGIQVYRYDSENEALDVMIRGDIADGTLRFPVTEGGTYILYDENTDGILLSTVLAGQEEKTGEEAGAEDTSSEPESDREESQESESDGESTGGTTNGSDGDSSGTTQPDSNSTTSTAKYCTIEIRCDALSSDMSRLTNAAVAPYIPANGVILAKTQVEIYEGETVFDVLKRVTRNKQVALEYGSGAYIKGIGHLYEFDAGPSSGWRYSVNGWRPNYGCGAYPVKDGDVIRWDYLCDDN